MRDNCTDFAPLFLNDIPLMDVRAPVEFGQGAFPQATNLPLMNDDERQQVGTCYKQQGQDAAIGLGHKLVSGNIKHERVAAWAAHAKAHPQGFLYCFRGGLRSQISQQWLKSEAGIEYPRVVGGYKALRTFLIDTTQQATETCSFVVLGGMTGIGKTEVLAQLRHGLDLEHHANHRGSSFGKQVTPQPTQIDFENRLAIDILKKRHAGLSQFVVEDESRAIGSCHIPLELHRRMQEAPVVRLEAPFEERVERILRDYVDQPGRQFAMVYGQEQGTALFRNQMLQSMTRLTKRLGGERCQRLTAIMQAAWDHENQTGSNDQHRDWIAALLNEYYDPMYTFQLANKKARIVFSGDAAAVTEYLQASSLGN